MVNGYYESCFSNITQNKDGVVSSGWDTFAVSEDLPPNIYSICRELQSKNSTGLNKLSSTAISDGQWEISVVENHLFYNNTQYGLTDYHGRPNLFSHMLIFPDAKNLLTNPNTFLAIASTTFAKSQEDLDNKTELVYDEEMTFETALDICQIDLAIFEKLLAAVYERINSDMIFEPLYIDCGDDRQKKALLYLIYSSLPVSLRPLLSLSSVKTPKVTSKQLVFDAEANKESYYFSLETATTSILADPVNVELPLFLSLPLSMPEMDKKSYFLELDDVCHRLGLANTTDEVALRFCHLGITSRGEEDLLLKIKDGLRISQRTSELDFYLAVLLKKLIIQGEFLEENDEYFLTKCQNTTKDNELKEIISIYFTNTLLRLESYQALAKLKEMDKDAIAVTEKHLSKSETGINLYRSFLLDYFHSKEVDTLKDLLEVTEGLIAFPSYQMLLSEILTKCKNLFIKELSLTRRSSEIAKVYQSFKSILTLLSADNSLLEDGQEVLLSTLKFDNFTLDQKSDDLIHSLTVEDQRKTFYLDLLDLYQNLKDEKDSIYFNSQLTYFIDANKKSLGYLNIKPAEIISKLLEFSHLSANDKAWICCVNKLNDWDAKTIFENLKAALAEQNFTQFMTEYEELLSYPEGNISDQDMRIKLFGLLFKELSTIDDKEMVPLDIWLITGQESHARKVAIDAAQPRILRERIATIISDATLLDNDIYRDYLKAYVKSKGKYSKIVSKILKNQAKDDSEKAKPSFFEKLFSRKKKKESDE